MYSASPPIHCSPLNVLRTLSALELPGLLEQPLHAAGEAQDRDQEEEDPDDADARGRAPGGEKMSLTASAPPPVRS